jgi:hypothetical protein
MKKRLMAFIIFISLISFISAKIDVSTSQETFDAKENITLRVSLLDENNNPINDPVSISIEDAEKITKIQETIPSNEFVEIDMGEGITHGYWNVVAKYQDQEAKTIFMIESEEMAEFSIENDILIIKNIGNTRYTKTVQIIIGDTIGVRTPKLDIGEEVQYRLIAPEGQYNIKITDGTTTFTKGEVQLTGTGQAIGALDERSSGRTGITGGISPDEDSDIALLNYIKESSFVYVFIFVVFGVAILLAIQRKILKK